MKFSFKIKRHSSGKINIHNDNLLLFLIYFSGVLAVLFLIIIVCIVIAVMYFREKGDYSTKEATGQDFVDNPDAALVINSTGVPDIESK
jgi:heme/copper-type cytochrome/quinol oxidase subunit 2